MAERVETRKNLRESISYFHTGSVEWGLPWVLKPVARQHRKVVPERGRVSVRNFFSNLASPIRFANCLLQAATEKGGRGQGET